MQYKEVQFIAKQTMDFIRKTISPGMKLTQVRNYVRIKMLELGARFVLVLEYWRVYFERRSEDRIYQDRILYSGIRGKTFIILRTDN